MENYSAIKKGTLPFVTLWIGFEGIMPKWSKLEKHCMTSCADLRATQKCQLTGREIRFKGLGVGKIGKGSKKIQTSSYKRN